MIDPRTRQGELRRWAAGALGAVYLLAFVPLVTQGVTAYLTRWFAAQMVLGVASVWLYPQDHRRHQAHAIPAARPRSDAVLVRAPRG